MSASNQFDYFVKIVQQEQFLQQFQIKAYVAHKINTGIMIFTSQQKYHKNYQEFTWNCTC